MTRYDRIDQVETEDVSVEWIMRQPAFTCGVIAKRANHPPRFDSYGEAMDAAWNYERGRLWATIAPRSMPVWTKGKLNPKAVALFNAMRAQGLMPC
jgi:hypothetical protein